MSLRIGAHPHFTLVKPARLPYGFPGTAGAGIDGGIAGPQQRTR
ncbi:MAG TPA: hypothetical protein VFY03_14775 [Woeseiaceae bacterium]|nr:hypothetical protein [Woeseiaceae bacterium]